MDVRHLEIRGYAPAVVAGMPATRLDFDAADAVAACLAGGAPVDVGTFVSVNERSRHWCTRSGTVVREGVGPR